MTSMRHFAANDRFWDIAGMDPNDGVVADRPIEMLATAAVANRAPIVTTSVGTTNYLENSDTPVDLGLAVLDPDNPNPSGTLAAWVRIIDGYRPEEDRLAVASASYSPITSIFDVATGMLSIRATAQVHPDEWRLILANVRYLNLSDTPATHARTVSFVANDGTVSSAPAFKTVSVTAVNDAPALDLNGAAAGTSAQVNYIEQTAPVVLMPDASVVDRDSSDLGGGMLRITYVSRLEPGSARDVVSVSDRGEIRTVNGAVLFRGIEVGRVTGGVAGADLTVNLNAAATPAAAQAVLRAITYYNDADTPPVAAPSFEVRLTDGDGGTSAVVNAYAFIYAVEDPTIMDLNGGLEGTSSTAHFASPSTLSRIAPNASFTDRDTSNFAGLKLSVDVTNARAGDSLALFLGTGPDDVTLSGDLVMWRGSYVGYLTLDSTASATISFNGGIALPAAIQALLRSIGFTTSSGDISARDVTIRLFGSGTDLTASAAITFEQSAKPTVLTGTSGANVLTGGTSGEVLRGLGGNDVLSGLGGRDLLDGGSGNDKLTGGADGDVFLFAGRSVGSDQIRDFGMSDVLVTSIQLVDKDGDGKLGFGSDRDLDFAGGGQAVITTDTGARLLEIEYDGSFVADGTTYYVYSRIGSAAGVVEADLLI